MSTKSIPTVLTLTANLLHLWPSPGTVAEFSVTGLRATSEFMGGSVQLAFPDGRTILLASNPAMRSPEFDDLQGEALGRAGYRLHMTIAGSTRYSGHSCDLGKFLAETTDDPWNPRATWQQRSYGTTGRSEALVHLFRAAGAHNG